MTRQREQHSSRFFARWIHWSCRLAWPVIALATLLAAASAYFTLTHLAVDARMDGLLSRDLPFRQNEMAIRDAFPQTRDVLSIVVESEQAETADEAAAALAARLEAMPGMFLTVFYPESHPFVRRNELLYLGAEELQDMRDRLAQAQPLLSSLGADPTLRGLTAILAQAVEQSDRNAAAALAPALNKMVAAVRNLEEGRDARLSWRSLLDSAGADGGATARKVILVQPVPKRNSIEPVMPALGAIYEGAKALGLNQAGRVEIRVTGDALMLQEELQSVKNGMGLMALLCFGLVVLLLMFGLQSLRLVAATLFTLAVGLSWTVAFAVASFGPLNVLSIAFAMLFIGLSVNFGIHFALRYRETLAASAPGEALEQAGAGVGLALLLSAAAAAIGFLSFLPADYQGMSELGVISAFGAFVALFLNITLMPALLSVMPMRVARDTRWTAGMRRTGYHLFVRRYAPVIAAAAGILGVIAASIAPYAWFDDDPLSLRDPGSPAVQTLLELLDDPRTKPYSAELLSPDVGAAERIASRLESLPQVEDAVTVKDLMPKNQGEKLAIIEQMALILSPLAAPDSPPGLSDPERRLAFEELRSLLPRAKGSLESQARNLATVLDRMPRTPESLIDLEQALLGGFPPFRERLTTLLSPQPVSLRDLPEEIRSSRLAPDGRALVVIHPKQDLREPAARQQFVGALRGAAPETSGPPVRFTAVGETVVGAFEQAALTAGIFIVLLLMLAWRRVLDVAMVMAPVALAVVMTVALTVLLKTPFNLANVIVLPLVVSLGVASCIQIVMRHRSDGGGFMERSTPRAVVFSVVTTIGSFSVLALSDHPGTASMGMLLMLSIGPILLCALLVLPGLLELTSPKGGRATASPVRGR